MICYDQNNSREFFYLEKSKHSNSTKFIEIVFLIHYIDPWTPCSVRGIHVVTLQ